MLRAIGVPELLVICATAVLLFGGKRFSQFGKGLGESIREFKKAHRELKDIKKEVEL
jgi:sec-independent protein translocase protein TatA